MKRTASLKSTFLEIIFPSNNGHPQREQPLYGGRKGESHYSDLPLLSMYVHNIMYNYIAVTIIIINLVNK